MASLNTIVTALAAQIDSRLSTQVQNLQVDELMISSPTPPSVDIYPSDPFMERFTMGGGFTFWFNVRPRVTTIDHEAAQRLMLALMDPREDTSLTLAIEFDDTLGGLVSDVTVVDGPSGYGIFSDPGSIDNRLLGAIWRVQVIP